MRSAKWLRALALLGLVLLLAPGTGCDDDENLGLSLNCVTFVPDALPTPGEVVAQVNPESNCDIVVIDLIVTGVDDIWGANFDIGYPGASVLISQDIELEDSFLGPDAIQELVEISANFSVGAVSRVDTSVNVGVTPDDDNNLLAQFAFLRIATSGSGPLTFDDANLSIVSNLGDQPMQAAPPIVFRGGTLSIVNQVP